MPWLEPDISDHLRGARTPTGVPRSCVVPIGFVSDHMEVIYDLDTEAAATAERLGLPSPGRPPPGDPSGFVAMVRDLVLERAAVERGEQPSVARCGELGPSLGRLPGRLLPQPARRRQPALGGAA